MREMDVGPQRYVTPNNAAGNSGGLTASQFAELIRSLRDLSATPQRTPRSSTLRPQAPTETKQASAQSANMTEDQSNFAQNTGVAEADGVEKQLSQMAAIIAELKDILVEEASVISGLRQEMDQMKREIQSLRK